MNLTVKQIDIMKLVVAGDDGAAFDLDRLIECLPYVTTKASFQFSLRALERHGLLDRSTHTEHRRGRIRRLVVASALGMGVVMGTGRPAPGPVSSGGSAKSPKRHDPEALFEHVENLPEPEFSEVTESLSLPAVSSENQTFPQPGVSDFPELLEITEVFLSEPVLF
jgi:hypothetical protein